MKEVQFSNINNEPVFEYTDDKDKTGTFDYKLKLNEGFNCALAENYEVELLINPILIKERHHFALRDNETKRSIGIIFPISMLDETEEEIPSGQLDYFAIAFYVLLKRLKYIKDDALFSKNFEWNICVCVFDLRQVKAENQILSKCIHCLRKYNYSYFIDGNNYQPIAEYNDEWFIKDDAKYINIVIKEPSLYKEEMVDTILRALPSIENIIHRFFLLYQVIELLIKQIQKDEINRYIQTYCDGYTPENDFFDNISHVQKERKLINVIFDKCHLQKEDYSYFEDEVRKLFEKVSYVPDKDNPSDLFYSFRNQMTHSLRNLMSHHGLMARTIFQFERVVMKIIEKYPN